MKRKRTIKLLFLSMLSISLLAIAAACGGEGNTETSSGANVSDTSSSSRPDSSSDGMEEQVTDYMLDEERRYTGRLVDGKPEGEGKLEWVLTNCVYTGEFSNGVYEGKGVFEWNSTGDKLEGIFSCGTPITGKYTYANTMSYEGEFNTEWKFEGEGIFERITYNADGSIKAYGWKYEGEFKNGSPEGCRGKVTFNQEGKGEGVYWFEGEMSGFPEVKKGQQGRGYIVYPDKSTYEGGIYYTSEGEWIRYGEGTQNFFYTTFTGASAGGEASDKIYCYVGEFDGRNHSCMYGNGVMYFSDISGNPTGYIKGTWNGMSRIGEWSGEWKEEYLLDKWKSLKEIDWKHEFFRKLEGYIEEESDKDMTGKTLLLGTSTFEYWYTSKEDLSPEYDSINFGVGGSTAKWWNENAELLKGVKGCPEQILLFIGGNDVASSYSTEDIVAWSQSFIGKLKEYFPQSKIVFVSLQTALIRWNQREQVKEVNAAVKSWIETEENIYFLDIYDYLYDSQAQSGTYYDAEYGALRTDVWQADKLHLNTLGYELFTKAIKEKLSYLFGSQ